MLLASSRCSGLAAIAVLVLAALIKATYCQVDNYDASEVIDKTPTELLHLRGYQTQVHFVRTYDGYYLQIVRVVNQKLYRPPNKRPVIFFHGLLTCSTLFLINSRDIVEAEDRSYCHPDLDDSKANNETFYRNGPMTLANYGYDVWVVSFRGTDYSLRHNYQAPAADQFWDFSLDELELQDLKASIEYVKKVTYADKIGVVAHSTGASAVIALLSHQPRLAKLLAPVVLLSPIAYTKNMFPGAQEFFTSFVTSNDTSENSQFPDYAAEIRHSNGDYCVANRLTPVCRLVGIITNAKDLPKGYVNHLTFYTSLKILRHIGQWVISDNKFQRYDYGKKMNLERYKQKTPPQHRVEDIISKALVLVHAKGDVLAMDRDIDTLKRRLRVPLYKEITLRQVNSSHVDTVLEKDIANLVIKPVLKVFEEFEYKSKSNYHKGGYNDHSYYHDDDDDSKKNDDGTKKPSDGKNSSNDDETSDGKTGQDGDDSEGGDILTINARSISQSNGPVTVEMNNDDDDDNW